MKENVLGDHLFFRLQNSGVAYEHFSQDMFGYSETPSALLGIP